MHVSLLSSGLGSTFRAFRTSPFRIAQYSQRTYCTTAKTVHAPAIEAGTRVSSSAGAKSLKDLVNAYLQLSKHRLSFFVVITSVAGYYLAPPKADETSTSWTQVAALAIGTGLTSACANTLNQVYEISNDKLMPRTRLRPLPRGVVSPRHALLFAAVTGLTGVSTLYATCNSTTAALSAANIVLYAGVYTPMKVVHVANTWVGAVVGGVPPLMGWAARTGGELDERALIPAALLYFWQIPHFMALSWKYRADYARGGYKMLAVENGQKAAAVAVRNCLYLLGLGVATSFYDLTVWPYAAESAVLNSAFLYTALRFQKAPTMQSATNLFRMSLVHLPLSLALMCAHRVPVQPQPAEKVDCFFKPGALLPIDENAAAASSPSSTPAPTPSSISSPASSPSSVTSA